MADRIRRVDLNKVYVTIRPAGFSIGLKLAMGFQQLRKTY